MKDIREWIEPELRETPMDIVAWGGVDVDAVIDNVARTFGRLDPRPVESESVHRSSVTLRGGLRIVLEAPVSAPRAVIEVVYPIDEDLGVAERARLQLLERVIEDRLRRVTRERLAMAYSPSASSSSGRFMPGSAYIGVHLASDPREVDAALASSRAVLEAIVDGNRINIEELNRVRKPLLEERRDRYQLDILSELRVDAAAVWTDQRELACIQAATPDQVMEFARRVLIPDRASVGVVRPGSGKEDGG